MDVELLRKLGCCEEALEWAEQQPSRKAAWTACERGDWMLWLLSRLSGPPNSKSQKRFVACCCDVAELALPYAGKNEALCLKTLRSARAYVRGEQTLSDVREAAYAARAARAARAAAYAAYAAAYAAEDAAYAARAVCAAVYAAVGKETLRQAANIVRQHYPNPPRLERWK
jgi:hypothetical protein